MCPVCHDHFQEPKILPCCHYYCKKCIRALAQASGANKPFPCPECRSDTLLSQNDLDKLPTAFFVNRMKELYTKMEKASGRVEALCEMCSGGPATAFCRHCTYFICSECVKSHQKMKVFAQHKVTTLDELRRGEAKHILIRQPSTVVVCPDHDKKMKIYCFDCGQLICRDCIIIDHMGHSYEFIKKVSSEAKKTIYEKLSSLKELHVKVCHATSEVKDTKKDVIAQKESTLLTIEKKFRELHEVLNRHKKLLFEETSQIAEHKLEELSTQEKSLGTTSAIIQSVIESVEHNTESSTDEELLSVHRQLLESIDEAISRQSGNLQLEPVEEADIRPVVTITAEGLQKVLKSKAEVKHTSADPTKCVVEEMWEPSEDGTKQCLTMILKPYLPNSKPTMRSQSVEVYIKSKVDGLVYPISPEQMPDNSYKIEYMPEVRGRHEVTISINDERVVHSPFSVFIAKLPPTILGKPVRIIRGVNKPWGIAINSREELVVTEHNGNVVFLDKVGTKLREIKRMNNSFEFLSGVAVDDKDNVYVADYSLNTLFKFNSDGRLIKLIGQKGSGPSEFNKPRGLTVAKDQVYVCDYDNNRVQVFTLELDFVKQISYFNQVRDISVDEVGNLYVCDTGNNCIKVFNSQEEFSYSFNAKDKRDLIGPCGVCVANDLVYVVENPLYKEENISVFTSQGNFVTSFGVSGKSEGQFKNPYGITVDVDGFVYVCDYGNSRIQVF